MYDQDKLRATYNQIAEDWHADHLKDDWWHEKLNFFCSLLPKRASVLDLGCAGGVKTQFMMERGFQVTGMDLSPAMIAIAERQVPQATFVVGDMRDLSGASGPWDALLAVASLLHIPKKDVGVVLKEWHDHLKPGGFLFVAVKQQRPDQIEEEVKTENDYGYDYQRFFSYFQPQELHDLLAQAGFTVREEKDEPIGGNHWLIITAERPASLDRPSSFGE